MINDREPLPIFDYQTFIPFPVSRNRISKLPDPGGGRDPIIAFREANKSTRRFGKAMTNSCWMRLCDALMIAS